MSVINLYNLLECTSINGTWTRLSATGPAAPNTYNGTIDLSSSPTALYEYQYTTNDNKTVKVSIDWVVDGVDRIHNVYTGAITIPITTISNIQVVYIDNNLDYCASNGYNKPTLTSTSIFDLPAYFPNNISGDLWYQILLPVCKEAYEVNITAIKQNTTPGIGLVVHTYYPDINITAAKLIKASSFTVDNTVTSVSFGVDPKARVIAFIRVFTLSSSLDTYTINVQSGHTCVPSEIDPTIVVTGVANAFQETFTADGTQTTFTVTKNDGVLPTSQDNIMVTRNGQFLQSTYFTHVALTGTITLTFTPFTGEEITIIWFGVE